MTLSARIGPREKPAQRGLSTKPRTVTRRSSPQKKRTVPKFSTEAVGRIGELSLRYVKCEQRTVLAHSYFTTPWKLLPPIYLDDTGAAYTLLVNPSGGLVGGDRLSIDMILHDDAHVLISAPSANRVYQTLGELSEQTVNITVGPGAVLEWMPEHTIPFAGSRFRQTLHAELAPGATLLLWDAVAAGRIAREERWAFTDIQNEIRITTAAGGSLVERYILEPSTDLGRIGLAEEWDYVASLYIVNDAVPAETWKQLELNAASIVDQRSEHVLGGVSTPAIPGVAIKLLARTAPDLTFMLNALWAAVRKALWNLPPLSLRKY